jgi:hypothetical protein
MIATADAHELLLLCRRIEYIDKEIEGRDLEDSEFTRKKTDVDVSDLMSLIDTLQQLMETSFGQRGDDLEQLSTEREILGNRVRQLKSLKNISKPFYDYGVLEFESLQATIKALKYIYNPFGR